MCSGYQKVIKVLGLALYGPLAASTRHRMSQYTEGLAAEGIDLKIQYLLEDEYLRSRFEGARFPLGSLVRSGLSRLKRLNDKSAYDIAFVHCELFPLMPSVVESNLIRKPYVYDFDDAFYLRYRAGKLRFLKPVLGNKFDEFIGRAAAVTAGSEILRDYANRFNSNAHALPTVVNTELYTPMNSVENSGFSVGWIGSPSTAAYLDALVEPLSILGEEGPLNFYVVGGKAPAISNVNVVELTWQEALEVEHISLFDVGVMPLPSNEWARGKCGFKLVQYMACGRPVVGSRFGANIDVVPPDCGFLVGGVKEWTAALRSLRDDSKLRAAMGQAGREWAVKNFSLKSNLPKLASVLRTAAGEL